MKKREEAKREGIRLLVELLRRGPRSVISISEKFDVPKEKTFEIIDEARKLGYNINFDSRTGVFTLITEPTFGESTPLPPITKREVKFMVLSDIGLGLKSQQGTILQTCYEIAKREEVFFIVILGNLFAGKPKKDQVGEFFLTEFEDQVNYAAIVLPRIEGVKQYFISGWRELSWFRDGQNPGQALAELRNDIRYVGDLRETFEIKSKVLITTIAMKSDAVTYTLSYALRGLTENLMEAVHYASSQRKNPKAVIVGGLGVSMFQPARLPLSLERRNNFHSIAVPALHTMTASQVARKKRGGSPELGCAIITVKFDFQDNFKDIGVKFVDLTPYQKFNDYLEGVKILPSIRKCERIILEMLVQRPRTLGDLSRAIGKSSRHTKQLIEKLQKRTIKKYGRRLPAYNIEWIEAEGRYHLIRPIKRKFNSLDLKKLFKEEVICGYASDSHLGEIHQRPELYQKSLETINRRCDVGCFLGDTVEGEGAFNGQLRELKIPGADNQRKFLLERTPKLNIPIFWILGSSHEKSYWEKVGHDIIATFAEIYNLKAGKDIIRYLGGSTGLTPPIKELKGLTHFLVHPKGGVTIGLSYRAQVAIENYLETLESMGAKVFAFGHLHVALFFTYKGLPVLLVPCLMDQSTYLKERNLVPWLGHWEVRYHKDAYGIITSIQPIYIAYESTI